eukprot:4694281-Amphidinium_carterae.2
MALSHNSSLQATGRKLAAFPKDHNTLASNICVALQVWQSSLRLHCKTNSMTLAHSRVLNVNCERQDQRAFRILEGQRKERVQEVICSLYHHVALRLIAIEIPSP